MNKDPKCKDCIFHRIETAETRPKGYGSDETATVASPRCYGEPKPVGRDPHSPACRFFKSSWVGPNPEPMV